MARVAATDYESVPEVAVDVTPQRGTVVLKFGGTSVAGPERLRSVAKRLVAAHEDGNRVVAVLSAMGATTDELVALAHQVSAHPDPRELDMLISVGERISCALAAMAINDLGHRAVSLTGSQAGIVTDTKHGKAKIVDVRAKRIHESLDRDEIVLVAGFQGVSTSQDVTTLGRGGSDTTAVALAAALGAERCEIYTDVEGVFTADPRLVPGARKLHAVSYEEMLELAASGAKVLQLRCVEFARNHDVPLHVRSTFADSDGTWILEEDQRMLEKAMIAGVTHDVDEAVYEVASAEPATLFDALSAAGVNVAPREDREAAESALSELGASWNEREGLGKVSIVGAGMKSHPGVAAKAFGTLAGIGVDSQFVSTSPIKIAFYVPRDDVERTVQALHKAFELAEQSAERDHG